MFTWIDSIMVEITVSRHTAGIVADGCPGGLLKLSRSGHFLYLSGQVIEDVDGDRY